MKPETRLKAQVLKELRKIPGTTWHGIQQMAIRGDPDIIGCVGGRFYAIECKNEFKEHYDQREKLQRHKLAKIARSGGVVLFITKSNMRFHVDRIKGAMDGKCIA